MAASWARVTGRSGEKVVGVVPATILAPAKRSIAAAWTDPDVSVKVDGRRLGQRQHPIHDGGDLGTGEGPLRMEPRRGGATDDVQRNESMDRGGMRVLDADVLEHVRPCSDCGVRGAAGAGEEVEQQQGGACGTDASTCSVRRVVHGTSWAAGSPHGVGR